jgi:hypothetical protein
MSSLEQFIATLTDTTARLDAELRELNGLRERVRKAQQGTHRPQWTNHQKKKGGGFYPEKIRDAAASSRKM